MTVAIKKNGRRKSSEQLSIASEYKIITDLETTAFNSRVTKIYMDQLPWRTTSTRIVKEFKLGVGQGHQHNQLSKLILEKEKGLAMSSALVLIGYRVRSRQEIAEKLKCLGISLEIIETSLNNLEKAGYLDDKAFVKIWIKERAEVSSFGRHRIKNELLSKGIDSETIDRELSSLYAENEEEETALSVAKKMIPRYKSLDGKVVNRRLSQALMRRGFGPDIARKVLREILN